MAKTYTAPEPIPTAYARYYKPSIFLAGSIEMGAAEDWQAKFIEACAPMDIFLLNPRRDNWDASLEQTSDNPDLVQQINWELDGIERADIVFMYLDPNTKSAISLLELGFCAGRNYSGIYSNKMVVCCPPGFWRKANVDVTCQRYGIPVYEDFTEAVIQTLNLLTSRTA